jgi:4-methylaminobutanoate oxidase (formaldehyde-forming)
MSAFESQLATARKLGIEVELASSELISSIAPTVQQDQIVGALHVPGDGYVDAHQCALALAAAAADLGVVFHTGSSVTELVVGDNQIQAVVTADQTINTPCVIITSGPWTGQVAAMAGLSAPMSPIRLQQARTQADPHQTPRHPVVRIPDKSCYLRPEAGGYLFGYFDPEPTAVDLQRQPATFATNDIEPPVELIDEARQLLLPTFPILGALEIDQYRQGMVTCTPDASYVVGQAPGLRGIWLATGCGAMGIAGSGAVGRWLSQWIVHGDPGADLQALSPDRFGERTEDREWIRQQSQAVCARYYALESVTYSVGRKG